MIILNSILPVFAIIAIGYVAGRTQIIATEGIRTLNNFVFYIALPALLFLATATAPMDALLNAPFIAANVGGIFASFFAAIIISQTYFAHRTQQSLIFGMNASYGTTGYMGIPLVIAAFGPEAALPGALATLLHNIPIICTVLLVGDWSKDKHFVQLLKPVYTNPLMISVLAGIVVAALQIPLPQAVEHVAELLANASGATALFAIGLSLVGQFSNAVVRREERHEIGVIIMLKLLLQPAVTIILTIFVFEMAPLWAAVTIVMSALPVGAGVFIFAQKYNELTRQTLFATFISLGLSIVTLSLVVWWVGV